MRWLVDTNVLSEIGRPRPAQRVLQWLSAQRREDLAISLATLAELRDGAQSAPPDKRDALRNWLDDLILPMFDGRILPVTIDILVEWLRIGRGLAAQRMARDAPDLLIAATARVHELTIVSRNARDFGGAGVVVYNPWTGETLNPD